MSALHVTKTVELLGLNEAELQHVLQPYDVPAYRARQIMHWIYGQGEWDIHKMTNLPKQLRDTLATNCRVGSMQVEHRQQAPDGTAKYLFRLADDVMIEAVLIRDGTRLTACLSSQAGCGIGCSFCATGLDGLTRNLTTAEIIGQLVMMQRLSEQRITNVVMMGMGEPLANYRRVMDAIRLMVDPIGCGMGQRRITISTSGVVPAIYRLAEEGLQVGLAVSLHAPIDALRDKLVPINKTYPIASLLAACEGYYDKTGRRVTMEYVLIRNKNDTVELGHTLGRLVQPLGCHVNLIPLNPVAGIDLRRSSAAQIERFRAAVSAEGVSVTVRKEMGTDIDAACGQLRRNRRTVARV